MKEPYCLPPGYAGPCMDPLLLNPKGVSRNPMITDKIDGKLERGELDRVNGIIVHQTSASTAKSTFNYYGNKEANGAHFLIAKDGTIYQTASLFHKTWHVGRLRSRCIAESSCTPVDPRKNKKEEYKYIRGLTSSDRHDYEKAKPFPRRYPFNDDSLGIEIVGKASETSKGSGKWEYEAVNDAQNSSLTWLVDQLAIQFGVSFNAIFKHPTVSQKTPAEASTADWNFRPGRGE